MVAVDLRATVLTDPRSEIAGYQTEIEKSPTWSMLKGGMEKFRIAQYGFIQMVALAYGILASGATVKISKQTWAEVPFARPRIFDLVSIFRDYGLWLSVIIIFWAAFCAYHVSIFSKLNVTEETIVASGLVIAGIFFILSSIALVGGIANIFPPASLYK